MKGFLRIDHEVRAFAARLPGSAGWALLEILSRSTLRQPGVTTPEIMIALGIGERTAFRALSDLAALGVVVCTNGVTTLAQDWRKACDNSSARLVTKLTVGRSKKAVSHSDSEPLKEVERSRSKRSKRKEKKKPPSEENTPKSFQNLEISKPKPDEPMPRDEMFDAIAVACFGGLDGLTKPNATRIGAAKKTLVSSGYSAADVPKIAAWINENQAWREGIFDVSVLITSATSWRNHKFAIPKPTTTRLEPDMSNHPSRRKL
jgi:hypothetical protein